MLYDIKYYIKYYNDIIGAILKKKKQASNRTDFFFKIQT